MPILTKPFIALLAFSALAPNAAGIPAVAAAATCDGARATIVGTSGDDRLTGTPGRDVIAARGGDDVISSRGGDDALCGGSGADRLIGGNGADAIVGGRGSDTVRGGSGDDALRAEGGAGGTGDFMYGGTGDDDLVGSSADDAMWPGPGNDSASGRGETFRDWILFTGSRHGVTVDMRADEATGQGRDHRLKGFEAVVGSRRSDVLRGSNLGDYLVGGATTASGARDLGRDVISGRGGEDFLFPYSCLFYTPCDFRPGSRVGGDALRGGPKGDYFDLSGRANRAFGGRGPDEFFLRQGGARLEGGPGRDRFGLRQGGVEADGGSGSDTVLFRGLERKTSRSAVTVDLGKGTASNAKVQAVLSRIENVSGSARDDDLRGAAQRNRLRGLQGDDALIGRAGADRLDGGPGTDRLRGGPGADTCSEGEQVSECES